MLSRCSWIGFAERKLLKKDFDGDQVGDFVTKELSGLSGHSITWRVRQPVEFPSGPNGLVEAILDEGCWIAVTSESIVIVGLV
jgi:hypothetical protein